MQFEIPEGAHVRIIVGSPAQAARAGTLPALLDAAPVERPAPRSGRLLLKGGLVVLLLVATFAAGDYFGSRPSAPSALGSGPGQALEQHAFPDRPLPREAGVPAPSGQVPVEFQKRLQQPPVVIPPPGGAAALPAPGSSLPSAANGGPGQAPGSSPGQGFAGTGLPGRNPFGLEN